MRPFIMALQRDALTLRMIFTPESEVQRIFRTMLLKFALCLSSPQLRSDWQKGWISNPSILSNTNCLLSHILSFSVVLVDSATGEILRHMLGQTQICSALAVAPDDLTAISGHVDGSIFLWDLTSGQLIRDFTGGLGKVVELLFSNDGQTIYSGSFAGPSQSPTLSFWDVATGELYRRLGVSNPTDALDLSADGRTILSGSYKGVALLWRIDDLPTLIDWTHANRYIRELTCTERELYRLEPLCNEESDSMPE